MKAAQTSVNIITVRTYQPKYINTKLVFSKSENGTEVSLLV
jgi:hypothetical protein